LFSVSLQTLNVAQLSLDHIIVGSMLSNQSAWVLAVPELGSISALLLHKRIVLFANPCHEVASGLQWGSPALGEK